MKNALPLPLTLTPKYVTKRLEYLGLLSKIEALASRGIILNTWQINELFLDGNRCYGKTQLAYVKIAEKFKDSGFQFTSGSDLTQFDPDAHLDMQTRVYFLRGLINFLKKHYSDTYFNITQTNASSLGADIDTTKHWLDKDN